MSDKLSSKQLIVTARGQLIGKYSAAVGLTLLIALTELLSTLITDAVTSAGTISYLMRLAIVFIIDLLLGVLIYGRAVFYLKLVRFNESDPGTVSDLFAGFKQNTDKAILLQLIFTAVSFLGSLPSILVSFEIFEIEAGSFAYYMLALNLPASILKFAADLFIGFAFYVLADNPDLSIPEILRKTLEIMSGNRLSYLMIGIRMIPLFLLGVMAFCIGILWVSVINLTAVTDLYLVAIDEKPGSPLSHHE